MINITLEYTPPNRDKFFEILEKLIIMKDVHITVLSLHKDQIKNLKRFLTDKKKGYYLNHISTRVDKYLRNYNRDETVKVLNKVGCDIFIAIYNRPGCHCHYDHKLKTFWENFSIVYDMTVTQRFLDEHDVDPNETISIIDEHGIKRNLCAIDFLTEYDAFVEKAYDTI